MCHNNIEESFKTYFVIFGAPAICDISKLKILWLVNVTRLFVNSYHFTLCFSEIEKIPTNNQLKVNNA